MAAKKKRDKRPARRATLLLMSGAEVVAEVYPFSPVKEKMRFLLREPWGRTRPGTYRVTTKKVACIAFPRGPEDPPSEKKKDEERFKVHIVGGLQFLVEALREQIENPVGFYGRCYEPASPFKRAYFFRHGVRAVEEATGIGTMLNQRGELSAEQLQAGLEAQRAAQGKKIGEILVDLEKVEPEGVQHALDEQSRDASAMETVVSQPARVSAKAGEEERRGGRLGELLIEYGLVSPDDVEQALLLQRQQRGKRLGQVLVEMGAIHERTLVMVLAKKFQMPFVDLDEHPSTPEARRLLSLAQMKELRALPLQVGSHSVSVAITDPLDMDAHDTLGFLLKSEVREVLVLPSQLDLYLDSLVGPEEEHTEHELTSTVVDLGELAVAVIGEAERQDQGEDELPAESVVRLSNKILLEGLADGASDIHLRSRADGLLLSLRLQGQLQERWVFDRRLRAGILARIRELAGMPASSAALQEGHITIKLGDRRYELFVSSLRNIHGESLVLRVLDQQWNLGLGDLGFHEDDVITLQRLVRRPFGLLLVAGMRGSGRTRTLYAMLNHLGGHGRHVVTIEERLRAELPGANQIRVDPAAPVGYAGCLRGVLRHDPDVILLGEVSDPEVATVAVQAALTGQLLFSSLAARSVSEAVLRLRDMGVPPYISASALLGVLSMAKLPRLCSKCRRQVQTDRALERGLEHARLRFRGPFFEAAGCPHCQQSGVSGEVLLYELLEVSPAFRAAIREAAGQEALEQVARQKGMVPRAKRALDLAERGKISVQVLMQELG